MQALTFDNGIMISSLKELKGVLPNLDDDVFKVHVNDTKNDIAKWVSENFSPEDGAKIQSLKTKADIVKALQNVGKSKPLKSAPPASSVPAQASSAPSSRPAKKSTAKKTAKKKKH